MKVKELIGKLLDMDMEADAYAYTIIPTENVKASLDEQEAFGEIKAVVADSPDSIKRVWLEFEC